LLALNVRAIVFDLPNSTRRALLATVGVIASADVIAATADVIAATANATAAVVNATAANVNANATITANRENCKELLINLHYYHLLVNLCWNLIAKQPYIISKCFQCKLTDNMANLYILIPYNVGIQLLFL
jgi:hypothetical protein